jgi:hypothetical protein
VLLTVETQARYTSKPATSAPPLAQPAAVVSLARTASDTSREALRTGQAVELPIDVQRMVGLTPSAALSGVAVLLVGEGVARTRGVIRLANNESAAFELSDGVAFSYTMLGSAGGLAKLLGRPANTLQALTLQPGDGRIEDVLLVLDTSV